MQSHGQARGDIDIALAGYIVMGMSEYAADLIHQGVCSGQLVIDNMNVIFQTGLKIS